MENEVAKKDYTISRVYTADLPAVVQHFASDDIHGLTADVARERLTKHGKNEFEKEKKPNIILKILSQFKDFAVIILVLAGIISIVMACIPDPETGVYTGSFIEPTVIFAIIILNICLALWQERSAARALAALQLLNHPMSRVIRNGHEIEIMTNELVVGDVIRIERGNLVPADARLLTATDLSIDESSLTGESEPVLKDPHAKYDQEVPLGDRLNMVYSGSLVANGHATCLVVATGMQTEMGKIAGFLKRKKKNKTPLQTRLDKVGHLITGLAIISAIILFVVGGFNRVTWEWSFSFNLLMSAVTLAVAAVPETLALIVTLILTNGYKKMYKKNALIKKLQAVETLGSTAIICSDKTGTLTMNRMTVKKLWLKGQEIADDEAEFNEQKMEMLKYLVLASNAELALDDQGNQIITGDSTEKAILDLAMRKGIDPKTIWDEYHKVGEISFSSSRKMMSVVVQKKGATDYLVLSKGAIDRLPFDKGEKTGIKEIMTVHDQFATEALRIIALAVKRVNILPDSQNLGRLEKDLSFQGLIGIIDPPRAEAAAAIARAKLAGIRTIMITGDHAKTAQAIAKQLGIVSANEGIITGQELMALSDDEFNKSIEFYSVYARMSPEDKIRIVKAWQARGEVVAMTGDGVNDAPALKEADVGIAMGINGTEVSKSAADMVLNDDRFATIIDAVGEGRNVFSNIRKLIYFLVVCNISEIIAILFAEIIGWGAPLTPIMLLLINVLGDGIPGMALAKEESDPRIMQRRPIERHESFFGGGMLEVIIQQIVAFALVTLLGYYIGREVSIDSLAASVQIGQTMAFLTTGWTSILHVLTVRSRKMLYRYRLRENPQLFISVFVMLAALSAVVAIPPLGALLGFAELTIYHWLICIALSLIPLLIAEYGKFWDNRRSKMLEKTRVNQTRDFADHL